ncbi:hypothetical protein POM88_042588 [Heracleum sosnowskyi]|uniref:SET domain-containing protein n=1 Tax=Heracleum sosnowskyi TaxID=360622 RepID=A0AAD8HGJ7_9APIA|nr:hypothetical protein POM88_042588 [Heracleum sosnowskyi]
MDGKMVMLKTSMLPDPNNYANIFRISLKVVPVTIMLLTERGLVLYATKKAALIRTILLWGLWESKDPVPEFYHIYLERPKGDADGYDLVVIDAMHKANYASCICHSCRPNCVKKVTAVEGRYQIGISTVRPINEFQAKL